MLITHGGGTSETNLRTQGPTPGQNMASHSPLKHAGSQNAISVSFCEQWCCIRDRNGGFGKARQQLVNDATPQKQRRFWLRAAPANGRRGGGARSVSCECRFSLELSFSRHLSPDILPWNQWLVRLNLFKCQTSLESIPGHSRETSAKDLHQTRFCDQKRDICPKRTLTLWISRRNSLIWNIQQRQDNNWSGQPCWSRWKGEQRQTGQFGWLWLWFILWGT